MIGKIKGSQIDTESLHLWLKEELMVKLDKLKASSEPESEV
jgi:hypothetical protein